MNKLTRLSSVTSTRPSLAAQFVQKLPKSWQPYARISRIDRPIGTWLLLSPGTWSLTMAATATHAPPSTLAWYLGLYGVGALITRSAGCTVNDLWDRKFDRAVERTKDRPLASGAISVPAAVTWLGVQGVASLGILAMLPNPTCWWLGALSVVPVLVYPAFKRFTYYPQIWLSIWFSWGAVLGFPTMGLTESWPAMISLLTSAASWSMIYDTVYGHQDKRDDVKVGVKSTALAWGSRTRPILKRIWVLQFASLAVAGWCMGMGPGFAAGGALAAARLWRMTRTVDLNNPASCGAYFLNNIKNGHIIWAGALVDYLLTLFF